MICNNCGKTIPENSKFCRFCRTELTTAERVGKVKGFSGWLAFLGFGLFISIFLLGYNIIETFPLLLDTYDIPGLLAIIQFEFVFYVALIVSVAYLLYLYFKRSRRFPKYFTWIYLTSLVFIIVEHIFIASLVAPTVELQNSIDAIVSESLFDIVKALINSSIWILYVNNSKKVKETFILD